MKYIFIARPDIAYWNGRFRIQHVKGLWVFTLVCYDQLVIARATNDHYHRSEQTDSSVLLPLIEKHSTRRQKDGQGKFSYNLCILGFVIVTSKGSIQLRNLLPHLCFAVIDIKAIICQFVWCDRVKEVHRIGVGAWVCPSVRGLTSARCYNDNGTQYKLFIFLIASCGGEFYMFIISD